MRYRDIVVPAASAGRIAPPAALIVPLAAAVAFAASTPALAQAQPRNRPAITAPGSFADPYFGTQGGRICRRWCLEDRNPCDPPNFKIADGRCSFDRND